MTTGSAVGERGPVTQVREAGAGTRTGSPPPRRRAPLAGRVRALAGRVRTAVRDEPLLLAVLVGSFLARWLVADRNSYWLDELLSVAVYGVWNDSATAAVSRLASQSVHPPAYQFVLFTWMEWFGDGERATRSLSNLYVTLATLFLYLLLRNVLSRRIAIASAVAFALMYSPMFYALETRSYAQTIFLVTLSSYLLLRMLRLGATRDWRSAVSSPTAALFLLVNTLLLLTHYYNVFFWAAQGALTALFVLRERPRRGWFAGLGAAAMMSAVPAAIFAVTWGGVLRDDFRRRGGSAPVDGGVRNPLELLASVVSDNLDPPPLVGWTGLAVLAAVAGRAVVALARPGGSTAERQPAWATGYLLGWLVLPFLAGYVAFSITGVARYSTRYWLFVVPALAPLVVLAVEEAVRLAGRGWRRVRGVGLGTGWATAGTAVVLATLVLPGTLAAAGESKADWRGTAQDIAAVVASDPAADYLVYETSFSRGPLLDYYLARYTDEVRVTATIRRRAERTGEGYSFERPADRDLIAAHDFLIVAFIHHRTTDFPIALRKLSETYRVHHWQVDPSGRGLVIFAVSPDGAAGPPAGSS
jgi:hypothetical protein